MMQKINHNHHHYKDLNTSSNDSMIIDWEKEYQIKVKQKVERAKDSIFKMVDKIESG